MRPRHNIRRPGWPGIGYAGSSQLPPIASTTPAVYPLLAAAWRKDVSFTTMERRHSRRHKITRFPSPRNGIPEARLRARQNADHCLDAFRQWFTLISPAAKAGYIAISPRGDLIGEFPGLCVRAFIQARKASLELSHRVQGVLLHPYFLQSSKSCGHKKTAWAWPQRFGFPTGNEDQVNHIVKERGARA